MSFFGVERIWYVTGPNLNLIRYTTGSQCHCLTSRSVDEKGPAKRSECACPGHKIPVKRFQPLPLNTHAYVL